MQKNGKPKKNKLKSNKTSRTTKLGLLDIQLKKHKPKQRTTQKALQKEKEEHEKETTIQTVLRAADHVSPLHVSQMPQYIGLTLLVMLGLAYSISFLYLLVDYTLPLQDITKLLNC